MRILFDECVTNHLKKDFEAAGHEVKTVQELGYGNKRVNEREIARAEAGRFDVYLTTESNRRNTFQKDIGSLAQYREQYPMGFMILKVEKEKHPDYNTLKVMMPTVQAALEDVRNGALIKVHSSGVWEIHGLENKQKQEREQEPKQDRGITHSR